MSINQRDIDRMLKPYLDGEKAEMFDKIKELICSIKTISCNTCRKIKKIIEE